MAAILTYTPSDVTLILSGYQLTGIVSISVAFRPDTFSVRKGIRGVNTRVQNLDTSATLTLTVLPTSVTNDVLSDLFILDKSYQSSMLEVSIKDNSGRTQISSTQAFVSALPQVDLDDTINNRVWVIEMLETTAEVRGNSRQIPDIFNTATAIADSAIDTINNII